MQKLKEFKEIVSASYICTFGDLISGLVLSTKIAPRLSVLPALIILIPPSADMRGNICGALGSRFGTYLHMGQTKPEFSKEPLVVENLLASLFLVILFSGINGAVSSFIASIIGIQPLTLTGVLNLVTISMIAATLSAAALLPATLAIAILSFKWGWDPDNVTSPLVSLAGDMVTIPLLYLVLEAVLAVPDIVKYISLAILVVVSGYSFAKSRKSFVGKRIIKEMTIILAFCAILDYGAGTLLGTRVEKFIAVSGFLTILPAFLEDGGVIGSILTAKIASWLHLGKLEPKLIPDKEVLSTFALNHVVGLVVFTSVGMLGSILNTILRIPSTSILQTIVLTVIAGQVVILALNFIAYELSVVSYKLGFDPDNVGVPLITSIMDFIGTTSLLFILALFGALSV